MHRHGLRDDQWDRITNFLPGPVSGTLVARRRTIACSSRLSSIVIAQAFPGVICRTELAPDFCTGR